MTQNVCYKCRAKFEDVLKCPWCGTEVLCEDETPAEAIAHDRLFNEYEQAKTDVEGLSLMGPMVLFLLSVPLVLLFGIGFILGTIAIVWGIIILFNRGPATQKMIYAQDKLERFEETHGYVY